MLNDILAPFPVTLVCTYDGSRLRPEVLADARRTHPVISTNGTTGPSADFEDPSSLLARWTPRLTPVPDGAASMLPPFDLAPSRAFVRDRAALAGVAEARSMDLALAASEILANAHDHGAGPTALRTWADGGYLVSRSTTPEPAWRIRSPATAHPEPSSARAAGCGSLGRSSTSCRSPPDPGGPRCGSRCPSPPRNPDAGSVAE